MKRLLAEPLLHFLVLGAALFAAYALLDRREPKEAESGLNAVRITEAEVAWLRETWARQWQREPTERELKGLLADYLREELLSREARELELDKDDVVVRRRLAQKMTFLVEDTATIVEPTDEELRQAYAVEPERFQEPARITFSHVYFNRDRRGEAAVGDARSALAELSRPGATPDLAALGDRSMVPGAFADVEHRDVSHQFGPEFAKAVFTLPAGGWHGPVESGFGLHLVHVDAVSTPKPRSFDTVRTEVLEEWRRERERTAQDRYLADLLKKHRVVVDESVKPLLVPVKEAGR